MGPTRKRDLTAATVVAAVVGYLLVMLLYRWFPPITVWTGLSLLAVAVVEAVWAVLRAGEDQRRQRSVSAPGWLHPLAVARSLRDRARRRPGWVPWCWVGGSGCSSICCPAASSLRVAGEDTAGAVVAAASALALVVAALWLQHCCKSPQDPPDNPDATPE